LWGDLDFPHIQSRCLRLLEMLPHAKAQVIKGTAHLPTLEQPEPCAAAIRAFLDEVGGGPGSRADHRP
jgi:pimeloyl-ACP methyl ester carboxylesterase